MSAEGGWIDSLETSARGLVYAVRDFKAQLPVACDGDDSALDARLLELEHVLARKPGARPKIRRPQDVPGVLPALSDEAQECFWALYLDSRCGLIQAVMVSKGSADLCLAHPREVFKGAVRVGACKIVVAHNHPSGVLEPSQQDLELTDRLREAGRVLGIPLLDHVIVSASGAARSVLPEVAK